MNFRLKNGEITNDPKETWQKSSPKKATAKKKPVTKAQSPDSKQVKQNPAQPAPKDDAK